MSPTDPKQHRLREAAEVGCSGLVAGIARNLYTHTPFDAEVCTKADGPFYCATCNTDAILHKCTQKIDHFAHIARLSPVLGPLESELHASCKTDICAQLAERHPDGNWAVERTIPANPSLDVPELRPDISGRIFNRRVAIEVQASALTPTKIAKRSLYAVHHILARLPWLVLGLELAQ